MIVRNGVYDILFKYPAVIPGDFSGVRVLRVKGVEDAKDSNIFDLSQSMGLDEIYNDVNENVYDIQLPNGVELTICESWISNYSDIDPTELYTLSIPGLNSADKDKLRTLILPLGFTVNINKQ